MKFFQKSQKFRFFQSCRTLITNQVSGKTQLSKVVTLLKRFGDRLDARGEIRNFLPFFGLTRTGAPKALWGPRTGSDPKKMQKLRFFQSL